MAARPDEAHDAARLVKALEDLHQELEGLRRSARLRAVIEQAKGVLVERHGISLDEAFTRLRELSQEHNVRLVEVAATVVGVTLPDDLVEESLSPLEPPLPDATGARSATWAALRAQDDVMAKTATAVFHGVSSSVNEGDEAARVFRDLAQPVQVDAVVLYRVAPDGSLSLLGSDGYPQDVVSAWRGIPLAVDVPLSRAVQEVKPVYLRDRDEQDARFPAIEAVPTPFQASTSIPVLDGGQVVGVVGMYWTTARDFDVDTKARLEHLVQSGGPVLVRSARQADSELAWVQAVLTLLFDPWLVLDPVRGDDGCITDFVVAAAAPQLPDAADLGGRRLLEMWPGLGVDGTFEALAEVAQRGGRWEAEVGAGERGGLPLAGGRARAHAVRATPRVLISWRSGESGPTLA